MDNKIVIDIDGFKIGNNNFAVIAGPCAVESEEHIVTMAKGLKNLGANILRGGAFKPRTSPYSFQGCGRDGVLYLKEAKKQSGLPIITEIISHEDISFFEQHVDIIQVGARNMHNYNLLEALGKCNKPVLLKRGLSATIKEWILAAEYIVAGGNEKVIMCERGIRTFETASRNTLDIGAVPILKKETNFPVIVDPSHAGGHWWMVEALSKAALAVGADGIMVEVHDTPEKALSDGGQSLKLDNFEDLMKDLKKLSKAFGKEIV